MMSVRVVMAAAALSGAATLAAEATTMDGGAVGLHPTRLALGETVHEPLRSTFGPLLETNAFVFDVRAGRTVEVAVDRLGPQPDLIAQVFMGDSTGAAPVNTNFPGTPGPDAPFVGLGDDEQDDPFGGPLGDPRITFTAPMTSPYTLFVSAFPDDGAVGAPFAVTVSLAQVPLPAGAWVLGASVLSLLAAARRR